MKALLLIALMIALVGGGLKMAGHDLPIIDYPIGPMGGVDSPDPILPRIEIEAPGYDEVPAP